MRYNQSMEQANVKMAKEENQMDENKEPSQKTGEEMQPLEFVIIVDSTDGRMESRPGILCEMAEFFRNNPDPVRRLLELKLKPPCGGPLNLN